MTYDSDVENGGAADERSPMLRRSSEAAKPSGESSKFWTVLHFFGGGIYAPDASTYDPIEILLNTDDAKEKDELTVKWRDNKLSELSFIGVVAALLAGVLTSTGSWPQVLPSGRESPWPIRTAWYCGIILSLFSILTAADQTVRLHRLSAHRDGLDGIRRLLAKTNGERKRSKKTGRRAPSLLQVFTWQMPVMFLTTATISMITGMFLHVWSATRHLETAEWWDDNSKVALTFTVVALTSVALFFAGQISLYTPEQRRE
ncbi:uncharacterized protein EKO05_0008949 [Ascochyta rabiei]|uniref:uncharacterized protein n=1 Tax=Didymella rabiei TaxID=5454 RepID=UPI0018FF7BB2|nr:uncharacterized protein EKO05_0008949 [Ascochyta rabiei]UPX18657.1 hypothetical protein EKO05_0008949 [Ascochyta rabiei]